jgi:hypothetical protein
MRGIYNYVPETNHVFLVYNVIAILLLQFMVHVMLFPIINVLYIYISTLRSMCAVPNVAVFCSSLMPCVPAVVSDFGMVLVGKLSAFVCQIEVSEILNRFMLT